MFEREAKRERILEAVNREKRSVQLGYQRGRRRGCSRSRDLNAPHDVLASPDLRLKFKKSFKKLLALK
jgi:hypothetical protein